MTSRTRSLLVMAAVVLVLAPGCSKARKDSVAYCNNGIEKYGAGDLEEAQDSFEAAIRVYPRNQIAHQQLGTLLLFEIKDYAGARRELTAAIELNPRDAESVYLMGRLEMAEDNLDAALARFIEAAKIDPRHAGALYYSGVIQVRKQKLDEADGYFRSAIAANPTYPRAFNSLGLLYYETENYDAAISVFKEGIRLNEDDADLHHNLGLTYLTTNKVDEAVESLTDSIELDAENPTAAFNLANGLIRQQKFKTASFFLRRVIVAPELQDSDLLEPAKLTLTSLQQAMAQGIGNQ